MQDITKIVQKTFEEIKIEDETGFEFWSARDLMKSLGYKKWERFSLVIKKAKLNCKNSGGEIDDNFLDEKEFFQEAGKTPKGGRPRENYYLTRYACYLIALNGDSRLLEISLAKTYFASQTRKLELAEKEIENTKRLEARKKSAKSEREIEDTIYKRGIKLPIEFATFKNKGIQALYGLSVKALKIRKNIPERRALADFDTEVELKAKDFIYAMTDHNIKNESGSNGFILSSSQWINKTNAIGIISKPGRYGGTYAHKDIAFFINEGLTKEQRYEKLLAISEIQKKSLIGDKNLINFRK